MYIAFFWRKNTGFVDRIYLYYIRIHIKDYVTRSTSFALLFVVSLKSAELHQVHAPLSGTVRYGHEIKLSLLVIIQTGNAGCTQDGLRISSSCESCERCDGVIHLYTFLHSACLDTLRKPCKL